MRKETKGEIEEGQILQLSKEKEQEDTISQQNTRHKN